MPNKPLNLLEKAKLGIYRALFTSDKKNGKVEGVVRSGIMSKLEKLMNSFSKKEHQWADKLQQDFENLEERNQKKVDQLMDWLENNPEEALKYAIPLDDGTGRGELIKGQFDFARRWDTFSLFGGSGSALGGPTIDLGAHHDRLRAQYNKTAEELIKNGNYQKAAFVYLKLLKNNSLGAETLEKGGFYQEAATVYLKQVQNKEMAAHCYEKGRMTTEAIELYAELKKHEKVGDLYMSLQKKKEGISSYEKHVDQLTAKNKYVNASLVVRNKMGEEEKAQTLLIKGWDQNKEAYNCINNYLSNVKEAQTLKREIEAIYANKVNDTNREIFLKVIHKEYRKNNEVKKDLKEMAYEIIAKQAVVNPTIVDELRKFNTDDREIRKDTIRFTRKRRMNNVE